MRAHGPYQHGERWRILVVGDAGRRTTQSYASREAAVAVLDALRRRLSAPEALELELGRYEEELIARGGTRSSVTTELYRVRALVGAVKSVHDLTAARCLALYRARATVVAVDTHRNELSAVQRFGRWLAPRHRLSPIPYSTVQPTGKRRKGKPQPTIDESRKVARVAAEQAREGDLRGLAVLTLLELGLRAGELVRIVARDLDDGGRVLWIPRSKTEAGKRRLEIPDPSISPLSELLLARAREVGTGRLFDRDRCWPRKATRWACALAGVDEVCAHALRGLHATLATEAGTTSHAVARSLGHTSPAVTEAHYTAPETLDRAARKRALRVIAGGRE